MSQTVSVIIPVYNRILYLEECLKSVINQTHRELEIIVVDDGSTDGSADICDEFAKNDDRLIVIHKKNAGVSAARNTGLDVAKGEYIAFVDSDDVIHPQMIEILLQGIQKADIAMCDFIKAEKIPESFQQEYGVVDEEIEYYYDPNDLWAKTDIGIIWNKLYHKEDWKSLRFAEGRIYEDRALYFKLMDHHTVIRIKKPLYFYRTTPISICHSAYTRKKVIDRIWAEEELLKYLEEHQYSETFHRLYYPYCSNLEQHHWRIKGELGDDQLAQSIRRKAKDTYKKHKDQCPMTYKEHYDFLYLIHPIRAKAYLYATAAKKKFKRT